MPQTSALYIHWMDIDSINAETLKVPWKCSWKCFNPGTNNKVLKNFLSKDVYKKPNVNVQGDKAEFMELSFVDCIFEVRKLRWTILRAKDKLATAKVLKRSKHLDGTYSVLLWKKWWKSPTMRETDTYHGRKILQCNYPFLLRKTISQACQFRVVWDHWKILES